MVGIGLGKFFDRVNHDVLVARVARKVKDKRLLRLIRVFSGVRGHGDRGEGEEGTCP